MLRFVVGGLSSACWSSVQTTAGLRVPSGVDSLWGAAVVPVGQVESLELAPVNVFPVELREGQENQESVVHPPPASQQN